MVGGGDANALMEALGEIERYPDLLVADLRLARGKDRQFNRTKVSTDRIITG